jgi:cytoskeletal protein RodZ
MIFPDGSGNDRPSDGRTRELDSAGPGELLRRARERRGLTLEQISSETKIPRRHLEALERDNLAAVPGGFYRRAQVRAFARAVHLDPSLVLFQLERTLGRPAVREPASETPSAHVPASWRTRVLIVMGVGLAAALLAGSMAGRPPLPVPPLPAFPVGAPAEPMGLPDARASALSNGDLAKDAEPDRANAAGDSITELVVTTEPTGARVTVDGIGWGSAPVTIRFLPAGGKRIRVIKEGYESEERAVSLVEGRRSTLDIHLRSAP